MPDQEDPVRDTTTREGGEAADREPTVLDWFKSVARLRPIPIPEPADEPALSASKPAAPPPPPARPFDWREAVAGFSPRHLRLPVAMILAFIAQFGLAKRAGPAGIDVAIYLLGAAILGWGYLAGDFKLEPLADAETETGLSVGMRPAWLMSGLGFSLLTMLTSGGDTFRLSTVIFWTAAIICVVLGFWQGELDFRGRWARWKARLLHPELNIHLTGWHLAIVGVLIVAAFFRFVNIGTVPFEMWSDHAEKLLDVYDVLHGKYSIFFFRNTGREPLEFYMAVLTDKLFGTGVSFLTLKLVTAFTGFITLPYIYLFGKEIGGKRVGLLAMAMAGVGYWPNVISRMGLRYPYYAAFAAPTLYYLVKGLRTRSRNDLLLCGAAVGIGLNGYSPARVLPLVVVVGIAIYLLHAASQGQRRKAMTMLFVIGAVALVFFLPLLHVVLQYPEQFFYRMLSRMATTERPFPGPPLQIFASNMLAGLAMFGWDDGNIWIASLPHRPAFDWITAALFHLGVLLMVLRYARQRDWRDAFTLISIPVLLLPSTLALAFPDENPALHRASGAYIPAFTLAAMAMFTLLDWGKRLWHRRTSLAPILLGLGTLMVMSAVINYRLVLVDFLQLHLQSTWNTNEAGQVVKGFAESIGSYDTAHMVPYPYWMDGRLVGITAGQPYKDYSTPSDQLPALVDETRAQLFLVNTEDTADQDELTALFPDGRWSVFHSTEPGKDFLIFMVPAKASGVGPPGPPEGGS